MREHSTSLRAPLTALEGWSHVLARPELDDSSRRQAADRIDRNLKTQVKLVDDLLDLSRILSGRLRLQRNRIDLLEIVRSTVETMRPCAAQNRLDLSFTSRVDAAAVLGDAERLRQVTINLLSNAIKFSPPGGTVDVEVVRTEKQVRVSVTDTGKGIPPAFLPRVFDRFSQAAAEPGEPTVHGLGLAIARHLVEQHEGTIRADSAGPGRGAMFSFQLPLAAEVD